MRSRSQSVSFIIRRIQTYTARRSYTGKNRFFLEVFVGKFVFAQIAQLRLRQYNLDRTGATTSGVGLDSESVYYQTYQSALITTIRALFVIPMTSGVRIFLVWVFPEQIHPPGTNGTPSGFGGNGREPLDFDIGDHRFPGDISIVVVELCGGY